MSSSSEIVKESKNSWQSLGRTIIDHLNIFENVRQLCNNILYGDARSVFRSTFKVASNVMALYPLRKMIFPIMLAIVAFTISKFFFKLKQKETYVTETTENEATIINKSTKDFHFVWTLSKQSSFEMTFIDSSTNEEPDGEAPVTCYIKKHVK